jgi:hypothetical protein
MGKEAPAFAIALTLCMAGSVMAADSAVIVNSGSTNTAGFRISVNPSGDAEYTVTPRRSGPKSGEKPAPATQHISDGLAKRLFSDLEAAQPLASLPQPRCAKSASFGTRLTIEFGDSETPDLSCGDADNAKLRALIQDATEVVAMFRPK